ncbi:putative est1 DNA/RNA binding domain [Lyophyllum shimeji]|uniref:Est1 DNA/RNA binding domain n=1 Tax=Lyophyllum shimeji TaxID=47721 RepID=A0A9P3PGZ9_LYOSH|nr:putative est1 DNA/RNA binding domain [Lyophyllum shimeji]
MADRPLRKPREVPKDLQPTDLAEKITALQRRTAGPPRPRERTPHSTSPPAIPAAAPPTAARSPRPPVPPRRNVPEADHDEFSRRLKISSSPAPQPKSSPKLFNPQADPIPLRRTAEPEAMSDATSSSYLPRPHPSPNANARERDRDAPSRQLFDHRKDDPVRFSVLARPPRDRPTPVPKSSADFSASSTSSYSVSSSAFTLSSTTDGSSASSALFDRPGGSGGRGEDGGNNVLSAQLKKLYRDITHLETKVKMEDSDERDGEDGASATRGEPRVTLKGKQPETSVPTTEEDIEREKWKNQIANHKQLAEYIHNLLDISLAPSVPASLRSIPTKYNIIVRLWTYAFHKLLESLRRASFASPLALEHLQDFIYYAYTFYTGLLEEQTLASFKSGWLEALGDLARYRMAVAAMVGGGVSTTTPGRKLTMKDVHDAVATEDAADGGLKPPKVSKGSTSDKPAARIDDSPSPSVGIAAARLMEVEPETERWRAIAREWYGAGLAEQPGTGKLHHHLGLLCREVEGEELKGVYHFAKSMTTLHPFPTSRESVLPIWSVANQTRRAHPDTPARDLFVLLQGMLFTHIQLDDFAPTLARFIERLSMEDLEEREWIMMGIINVASIFEFGRPGSVLGRVGGKDGVGVSAPVVISKPTVVVEDEKMDVDGNSSVVPPTVRAAQTQQISPPASEAEAEEAPPAREYPASFKYALQLTFAMLSHVLKHPTRTTAAHGFARPSLNPYLTVLLTFLATVLKNAQTLAVLERNVPWEELATFFARIPRGVMAKQGLFVVPSAATTATEKKREKEVGGPRWVMLTSGCAPPLPEDWCLRGMEWVGRSVFERGYWKSGEERRAEIEVLEEREMADEVTDGQIEDDDEEETVAGRSVGNGGGDVVTKRWVRIARSAVGISNVVAGFTWAEGTREWKVEGQLAEKVRLWREQDRIEQEEEEKRRLGTRWSDDMMDVDEEGAGDVLSEEDEDDENDTPEVKELKARRRYLHSLLQAAGRCPATGAPPRRARMRKPVDARPALTIVPGYTVLVMDTNVLLSSLPMFASIIESLCWTVIVPLPVIMELDGLSTNSSPQLSEAAQNAMTYISSHIRSHSVSLKVQTSKGNYLTTLSIRTEQVDFAADGNWERNMDDLILKAAIWQEEHWLDRSAMLKADPAPLPVPAGTVKVVLLSLDRNLRLKARSRQLPAASEKDLANILANAK